MGPLAAQPLHPIPEPPSLLTHPQLIFLGDPAGPSESLPRSRTVTTRKLFLKKMPGGGPRQLCKAAGGHKPSMSALSPGRGWEEAPRVQNPYAHT